MAPEQTVQEIKRLVRQLQAEGRSDLLLKAIGVSLLEELRIEAAKSKLSRLVITEDYRFLLIDYNKEVELQPVRKAVYLLFLYEPILPIAGITAYAARKRIANVELSLNLLFFI